MQYNIFIATNLSGGFIKRIGFAMKQKYFLKKELASRYKVSVSTIERWVYLKNLPPPIRIGPNRILWDMQEILDWEQSRKESR